MTGIPALNPCNPPGKVFDSAFYRMGIKPLVDFLADKPAERIRSACSDLGASLEEGADVSAVFNLLPRFPVTLKIWLQDDELAGSANFIFDANANHYLHTEDVAAAASIIATSLISQYQLRRHNLVIHPEFGTRVMNGFFNFRSVFS